MVNYKYAEAYYSDSVQKQLKIKVKDSNTEITNENIYSESMELTESICSESELKFGSCEASSLSITVANIYKPLYGETLIVNETLAGHEDRPFQFGEYKVYSDKPTSDRLHREIVAYDAMYDIINADVARWYNTVLPNMYSQMTMRQFRKSFIEHFGLQEKEITLANDGIAVFRMIDPSELSGKDVINAICEINGCFGHISRDGRFEYIYLPKDKTVRFNYPSPDLFPSENILPGAGADIRRIGRNHFISCEYEDFETRKIDVLCIRGKENDVGVVYPNVGVLSQNNNYIIENNFLTYGMSAIQLNEIAKNLYSKISDITYRPYSADVKGNPCIEVGDPVRIITKHNVVESYVLKRTLKGIQALRDDFSAEGVEKYSEKLNSVNTSIVQLRGKANTLTRTIEETVSEIYSLDENGERHSKIEQNAEAIKTEVTARKSGENELSSRIEQTASSIELSVDSGEKTAGIRLSVKNEKGEEISSADGTIEMTGIVTFKNLTGEEGQTIINGELLQTGTVSCDTLNGGTINGQTIQGGTINGAQIYSGEEDASDASKKYTNIVNGEMRTNSLHMAESESAIATIYHGPSNSPLSYITFSGNKIQTSPKLAIADYGDDPFASPPPNARLIVMDRIYVDGAICPRIDEDATCGTKNYKWSNVYSQKPEINTSDKNEKENIQDLTEVYEKLFFKLKPKSFKFKRGDRTHIGIIAQDLEKAMKELGLSDLDVAAFCKDVKKKTIKTTDEEVIEVDDLDADGNKQYSYGVRYGEFIMLETHMLQKAYQKIDEQQKEIDLLKESVSFLLEKERSRPDGESI